MPKRKRDRETKEERWKRKMEEYGTKLRQKRRRICYSSDDENEQNPIGDTLPETPALQDNECDEIMWENEPPVPTRPAEPTEQLIAPEEIYDPDLLEILGDFEAEATEWGEDLHEGLSKRLQQILQEGLKKETKEELNKKYLLPKNTPLTKAPILNPEISNMRSVSEAFKNRDKHMAIKQNQLGKALSVLGSALTELLKKNPRITEVVRTLNDCSKLIADSHYLETYTRRSLVIPMLDKPLSNALKDRKRDQYLFGEDLTETVKTSNIIIKTGNMMEPQATTSALNGQGILPRVRLRRHQTAAPFNRAWGQRGRYVNTGRRGGPPQPQPPAARFRPPPPPPPPQRRHAAPAATARRRSQTDRQRL